MGGAHSSGGHSFVAAVDGERERFTVNLVHYDGFWWCSGVLLPYTPVPRSVYHTEYSGVAKTGVCVDH